MGVTEGVAAGCRGHVLATADYFRSQRVADDQYQCNQPPAVIVAVLVKWGIANPYKLKTNVGVFVSRIMETPLQPQCKIRLPPSSSVCVLKIYNSLQPNKVKRRAGPRHPHITNLESQITAAGVLMKTGVLWKT